VELDAWCEATVTSVRDHSDRGGSLIATHSAAKKTSIDVHSLVCLDCGREVRASKTLNTTPRISFAGNDLRRIDSVC